MPIYEYSCRQCHQDFELLVRNQEQPACPQCGNKKLDKLLSVTAAPATSSARDLPACPPAGSCGLPQCGMGGCGMGGIG